VRSPQLFFLFSLSCFPCAPCVGAIFGPARRTTRCFPAHGFLRFGCPPHIFPLLSTDCRANCPPLYSVACFLTPGARRPFFPAAPHPSDHHWLSGGRFGPPVLSNPHSFCGQNPFMFRAVFCSHGVFFFWAAFICVFLFRQHRGFFADPSSSISPGSGPPTVPPALILAYRLCLLVL